MSATITEYASDGMEIAAKSRLVWIPTVADIDAISVTEFNTGTAFECATTAFGLVPEVTAREIRKLCDVITRRRVGSRSWSVEALVIDIEDPQAVNALLDLMAADSEGVLVHRPGLEHDAAAAAAQKYEAVKVTVASQALVPLSSDEGSVYQATHELYVLEKNDGLFSELVA